MRKVSNPFTYGGTMTIVLIIIGAICVFAAFERLIDEKIKERDTHS